MQFVDLKLHMHAYMYDFLLSWILCFSLVSISYHENIPRERGDINFLLEGEAQVL